MYLKINNTVIYGVKTAIWDVRLLSQYNPNCYQPRVPLPLRYKKPFRKEKTLPWARWRRVNLSLKFSGVRSVHRERLSNS